MEHGYLVRGFPINSMVDLSIVMLVYQRVNHGKPPFSYGFSHGFPIKTSIFLWFSYGLPIKTSIFLWFSYGFPMVYQRITPGRNPKQLLLHLFVQLPRSLQLLRFAQGADHRAVPRRRQLALSCLENIKLIITYNTIWFIHTLYIYMYIYIYVYIYICIYIYICVCVFIYVKYNTM